MTKTPQIPRTAKGHRPQYFQDPATDKLLSMVMSLAGELSVTRQRLDAVERLLESQTLLDRSQLADYAPPDDAAAEEREQLRQELVDRLLSSITAELSEHERTGAPNREAIVEMLESVE